VFADTVVVTAQNEKTTLLGKTKFEYASILRWMSFFNSDLISALGSWFRPLIGRDTYNKKAVDTAIGNCLKAVSVVEKHLLANTFLVGERISLADIFCTSIISRGFEFVITPSFVVGYILKRCRSSTRSSASSIPP
jgi:elongation factor 1-gamma